MAVEIQAKALEKRLTALYRKVVRHVTSEYVIVKMEKVQDTKTSINILRKKGYPIGWLFLFCKKGDNKRG